MERPKLTNIVAPLKNQPYWTYVDFKTKVRREGRECSGRLQIGYTNAAGEKTSRAVQVEYFLPVRGEFYLLGFCELRSEERTFHSSKIFDCVDTLTGKLVSSLDRWLHENSQKAATQALFQSKPISSDPSPSKSSAPRLDVSLISARTLPEIKTSALAAISSPTRDVKPSSYSAKVVIEELAQPPTGRCPGCQRRLWRMVNPHRYDCLSCGLSYRRENGTEPNPFLAPGS